MLINQKFFSRCKLYTHRPFMVELDNNLHLVKKTGVKPFAAAPENAKAKIFTTGSNCKALKKCNTKVVYLSKLVIPLPAQLFLIYLRIYLCIIRIILKK